jgi:hypothetical protein
MVRIIPRISSCSQKTRSYPHENHVGGLSIDQRSHEMRLVSSACILRVKCVHAIPFGLYFNFFTKWVLFI